MFQPNQQLGGYILIKRIGRGGFGEVWLAEKRSPFITKKVAIKLPLDEQVNFAAIRQEATLWEQASGHPNILPIIDADIYDGQVLIVSEYAENGSLSDWLKHSGKFPLQTAIEMSIGVLSGLEFLHSRRIIHRDIKPQNILLQGNTPRLADFGISRAMETATISSAITGTDAYMAPEAFEGVRSIQTDVWSVGVVLYQLLTNSLPFPQQNPNERMFAILTRDYAPLTGDVSDKIKEIVRRALIKQPDLRYQSAREMREDLERILVSIKHPTFAPTEIFRNPISNHQADEDKPITRNEPVFPVLPRPMAENAGNISIATHFVDNQSNQNQPVTLPPTQYNSLPPTVPAVNPLFQNAVHQWIFYFLSPIIGVAVILVTEQRFFSHELINVKILVELLILSIEFGLLGALLGYYFPQQKWKWGIFLNIITFAIVGRFSIEQAGIILNTTSDLVRGYIADLKIEMQFRLLILLVVFTSSSAASFFASKLALQKMKNKLLK